MEMYKKRVADDLLKRKLAGIGAVLIEGPKLCGKTTTAQQIAGSILYMADPQHREENLEMANMKAAVLLRGKTPRLIDEWQIAPKLWDAVRFEVDQRQRPGQFILTGSAVPADRSQIFHTGTGRVSWLRMRPMSLYESGESNGDVSLGTVFSDPAATEGVNDLDLEDLAFLTCRGGWPTTTFLSGDIALDRAFDYVDAIAESDISRADGVSRSPQTARQLLRSYARNSGSQANMEVIAGDMGTGDTMMSRQTITSYINALKLIFVIEDMAAWNPNLRSKTAIRTSDTRYFTDPSIAAASLGIGPSDLMRDLSTFGLLFETLCVRDLRVYAEALGGTVYHYRDKTDLECDAVVHLRNGKYGLIEIKLGGDQAVEYGAKTLKKLAEKLDTTKMSAPSFLMVLTAVGRYAYQRQDGVLVVPVGCLKP